MSEAILENGSSSAQNGGVTNGTSSSLIEDSSEIIALSNTTPPPSPTTLINLHKQSTDQTTSITMVTTTSPAGGTPTPTSRKSDHRVTFVECNNTEHGPPSSEDTAPEDEEYLVERKRYSPASVTTHTVIKSSLRNNGNSSSQSPSIIKTSSEDYWQNNGEREPLMVSSAEFTDSGYTDSLIGGTDTMHSYNGDVVDFTSSPHSPDRQPLKPVLRLTRARSTESHDNPFLADGELSNKADSIIRHSTISRTQLKVYDPDTTKEPEPVEEAIEAKAAGNTNAARPQDVNVGPGGKQQNGGVEDGLTPQSVEVEVAKANASQPEAQKAEEVKVEKDKKCACCVIQ